MISCAFYLVPGTRYLVHTPGWYHICLIIHVCIGRCASGIVMMTLVQVFRNISVVLPIHRNIYQCDDPGIPVYVRIIHDRIRTAKMKMMWIYRYTNKAGRRQHFVTAVVGPPAAVNDGAGISFYDLFFPTHHSRTCSILNISYQVPST